MSEKIGEFNQRIVQEGIFNLKNMSKSVVDWFEENNYYYSVKDSTTKEKSHGTESRLLFTGHILIDDFAKSEIKVDFFLLNAGKVTSKGKKLDKGDLEIRINGDLIVDYKHRFSSKFKSFLLKLYMKYLIPEKFLYHYESKVYDDAFSIFNLLKEEMNLST